MKAYKNWLSSSALLFAFSASPYLGCVQESPVIAQPEKSGITQPTTRIRPDERRPALEGAPLAERPAESEFWSFDSSLNAQGGAREVFLTWSPARGDVQGYQLFVDDELRETLDAEPREFRVQALVPKTLYRFKIEALYAEGIVSNDGPQASAETDSEYDPGFKRLTKTQYNNTVADLHARIWAKACEAQSCNFARPYESWIAKLTTQNWGYWGKYIVGYPSDTHVGEEGIPRGGFLRLDQLVYDEHIAYWLGSTMEIAGGDYEGWVGKNLILDPCKRANDEGETNFANDDETYRNCIDVFIEEFGMQAFRRPLNEEEHAFFMQVYDDTAATYPSENLERKDLAARGLRNIMTVIQSSPEFIYRVELGDENGALTPYELASRLSYHFWNTMPDDDLFEAARNGSLMTEAGYNAQVERLFNDPRSTAVIDEFYADFFRVQDIPDVRIQAGPSRYNPPPSASQYGGANLSQIRGSMQKELVNLGRWFTKTEPGSYAEMFQDNSNFLECVRLPWRPDECAGAGPYAEFVYQVPGTCTAEDCHVDSSPGWNGESEPVALPQPERAGLVTRLGVLAHDTRTARPIRRGLYIREALLCEHIPPPENCDVVKPPEVDITQTVREKVEAITEVEGTTCRGCHSTLINGFGFALNHFSSKGVYWEKEPMFSDRTNAEGEYWYFLRDESEWADIDASGTTYFEGEQVTVDGAHELSNLLSDSGKLEACWSRDYFRFAMGRIEGHQDEQAIESLATSLRTGTTLAEGYKAIANIAQFKELGKAAPAPQEVTP